MNRFVLVILLLTSLATNAQDSDFTKNTTILNFDYSNQSQQTWVHLPKNYKNTSKKFPVIYILEGENLFDSKKTTNWNIDQMLTQLKDNVILVGIESNDEKSNLLDFIITTLKPKIDQQFRTKKDAYNTAILGNGNNALIAFNATLQHQNVFGKAAVLSPKVLEDDSIYEEILKVKNLKSKVFLFSAAGDNATMVKNITKMEYSLNTNRCYCLNLTKVSISEELQDNEKLWQQGFEKAYLWLF